MKLHSSSAKQGLRGAIRHMRPFVCLLILCWQPGVAQSQARADAPDAGASGAAVAASAANAGVARQAPVARRQGARPASRPYAPVKVFDETGNIPEIEMFVGESRVLPAPGVGRVAVGNGKMMTAAVLDNKEILLFANEQGTSSLFIWNEDGRYQRLKINVVPGDTSRVAREVATFVSQIPGAKVSVVGQHVVVDGDRVSNQDLEKIKRLEKVYPQLLNFTHPEGWEKMVMIDVKVVEFPKNYVKELGLRWVPTGGGTVAAIWLPGHRGHDGPYQVRIPENGGLPITGPNNQPATLPTSLNAFAALNLGLNMSLQALVQDGKASILAEPQLSTRSGKPADFVAGGEYPYSVATENGPAIAFKEYGVKLSINPSVDRDGFIRSEIMAEVSAIDTAVSTPSGPALRTRKTQTHFNVRSGQTIVLSGMLSVENGTSVEKLPFLGDIPLLGALFRSKRVSSSETELVVFVTPTLVDANEADQAKRIDDVRERLDEGLKGRELLTPLPSRELSGSTPQGAAVEVGPVASASPAAIAPTQNAAQRVPQRALGGSSLRVLADGVVMRARPHAWAQTVTTLGKGSVVRLADDHTQASPSAYWRRVVLGSTVGWVPARQVEPVVREPAADAVRALNRAKEEGAQTSRDATVAAADPRAVSPTPAGEALSTPAQALTVLLPKLALRVAPDVNAQVLIQIPQGAAVDPLSVQPNGAWRAVRFAGMDGWVDAQWLAPALR